MIAAIFLPVLAFLFALAFPLGWIDPPDHDHLAAVVGHPITFLVLLGLFVLMLVHAAHRFRYTLYDGLQVKHQVLVAVLCYGGAAAARSPSTSSAAPRTLDTIVRRQKHRSCAECGAFGGGLSLEATRRPPA